MNEVNLETPADVAAPDILNYCSSWGRTQLPVVKDSI
jgi:hypothetical protein